MKFKQPPQKTTLKQIPHWHWENVAHSGEFHLHLPRYTTLKWNGFLSVPLVLIMTCLSHQLPCLASKSIDCLNSLSGESKHNSKGRMCPPCPLGALGDQWCAVFKTSPRPYWQNLKLISHFSLGHPARGEI